jgi:hypothetical protein
MGANCFQTTSYGRSITDAYRSATQEAEHEYGQDPYNGTISTTHGVRDVTREFKASNKTLSEFIADGYDRMTKRDCWGICLSEPKENKNKTKSKVEHIVTPGTKKWITVYTVENIDGICISSHSTKGAAVKAARAYTERNLNSTTITVEKKMERGSARVARVTYKGSSSEKPGRWVFFGLASE